MTHLSWCAISLCCCCHRPGQGIGYLPTVKRDWPGELGWNVLWFSICQPKISGVSTYEPSTNQDMFNLCVQNMVDRGFYFQPMFNLQCTYVCRIRIQYIYIIHISYSCSIHPIYSPTFFCLGEVAGISRVFSRNPHLSQILTVVKGNGFSNSRSLIQGLEKTEVFTRVHRAASWTTKKPWRFF